MALQIINRKFTDYQGRELSFPFFQGLDTVIARYDFQVEFSVQLSVTQNLVVSGNTMILTSGSWEDYGFFAGADISGTYDNGSSHTIHAGATVDFVDGATMTVALVSGSLNDGNYNIGQINCDETPEAVELYFNLVPNQNGATNEFSLIDGEVNRFQVFLNSLAVSAPAIPMSRLGNFSGGSEMSATISRLADVSGKRRYSKLITFKNWTIKDTSLFLATDCVKPWYKVVVFPEYQNPTVSIDTVSTPSDANTGGFNEVGNGGIPAYSLTSITWKNEDDEVLPAMDYAQKSKVEIVISGTFTASSKLNIGWFFDSIEDSDYKNLPLSIERNLMWLTKATPLVIGSNADLDSGIRTGGAKVTLTDINISQDGVSATITGKFEPNTEFTNFFESNEPNNRNYRLSVRVEDSTLIDNFIRPVWLDVDSNVLTKEVIPLGRYDIESSSLVGHDGESRKEYFIEDDLRSEIIFKLPRNNDFISLEVGTSVVKTVNPSSFILESFVCNLSEFPLLPDGTRPINKVIQRNFNLSPTNPHNTVEFIRDTSLDDVDSYGVKVIYSFLSRWEYWLAQPNADLFFFPNQNKDWFNYQNGDWFLAIGLQIHTPLGSYRYGNILEIKDYDDWTGTTTLEYFMLDGTPITKPLIDEVCKLRATHTATAPFELPNQGFGQITVEPFESASRWDISDFYDQGNVIGNPLIPLDGEARLKSTVSGSTYVSECLFDPTKLSNPSKISFTARFLWDEKRDIKPENRAKFTVEPVKMPKDDTPENRGVTDNCVECMFDVHADLDSNDTYKNMVSSRWFIAETATFILKKCGELTVFQPTTQSFPNDTTAKYCTIPWKDVLASDGVGCYELSVESETAGVEFTRILGKFNLNQFSWERTQDSVMIRSVFNDANLKQRINFTNANVVDCVLFDGDIEEFQPNTEINNLVYSNFQQNKVKRENRTTWNVNVHFSGYCVINQIINVHLLGENQLFVTDYRKNAFDKTILDKPVILEETPQMTPYYTSENQGSKFVVSEKVVDSVTKYGSVLASGIVNASGLLLPNVITTGATNDLYWELNFNGTDDVIFIPATVSNVGTFTSGSGSNVGTVTVSTDGVTYGTLSFPFTPTSGNTYYFKRSTATINGLFTLTGTY